MEIPTRHPRPDLRLGCCLKFIDWFAGIGGFSLGLERAGHECVAFSEVDPHAIAVFKKHWPAIPNLGSIMEPTETTGAIDLVCGGDPCPSRSLAKGNRKSTSPDLAGYFLAMVGRLRPKWVVRENVPSPDALHFAAALELLKYGVTAIALDARDFTGQSRRRQFIIGSPVELRAKFQRLLFDTADGFGFVSSCSQEETPIAACITAHPARMAAEDTYCYEPGQGLRVLTCEECEALQGFPRSWTDGLSRSCRRRLIGNAVPPPMVEWIGRRLNHVEVSNSDRHAVVG